MKMTAAMPRLSTALRSGLVTPMVTFAFVSQRETSSLTARNEALSYPPLESALMTRIPE